MQAAPPLRIFANIRPLTASATFASSRTTKGALPPSSIEQRITWSAASRRRIFPTKVEPVNERFFTRESWSSLLIAGPDWAGKITLRTPAGKPARSKISAIASAVSGVSPAGFKIMVQPAAIAGPILRVAIPAGKFQGVIRSDTPIGWWVTRILLSPDGAKRKSPDVRTASSENQRKNSAA